MSKKLKVLLGVLAFSLFIVFISGGFSPSTNTSADVASGPATPVVEKLNVGEEGYVSVGTSTTKVVLMGGTKEDYEEMFKLIIARDDLGVSKMVLDGRVLMVEPGTKVKVIGTKIGSREVRIMSGKYLSQSGWVPNEMVHRTP